MWLSTVYRRLQGRFWLLRVTQIIQPLPQSRGPTLALLRTLLPWKGLYARGSWLRQWKAIAGSVRCFRLWVAGLTGVRCEAVAV